jgi:proton-translocating NADH-quinone oxidoreductase chain M
MFSPIILMLAIPAIAFAAICLLDSNHSRKIILCSTLVNLAIILSISVYAFANGGINISSSYNYISSLGVSLSFGISPISLVLLVMSSIVLFVTALSGNPEKEGLKLSSALIALFQIASIGLFASTNLFIFFIFWDVGIIVLFLMINILGSSSRGPASINFLIYEIFASSLLLLAIILIYVYTPVHSFNIMQITANASLIPTNIQTIIFVLLFVAFMINMPLFPVHFWLPDAHTEASTQGSMMLSGVLTKFGGFGMIILFSMLPVASSYSKYIAILAGISAFYAVFLMMRQKDIKRIIAYSTIVEMSIIMLGISAMNSFGTYGAVYMMLAHGLVIALMFLVAGSIKYIFGERNIFALKGIVASVQSSAYSFLAGVLAMIGLPLTAGFIADLLIFIGSVQAFGILGIIPIFALVLMGAFMYMVISKSIFSTSTTELSKPVEFIGLEQKIGYVLLIFFIFLYGVIPFVIVNILKP